MLVAATVALAGAGIARIEHGDLTAQRADGVSVPADLRPLLATLRAARVDRVYANYWIAFPVAFESRERIVAATVAELSSSATASLPGGSCRFAGTSARSEGRYPPYTRDGRPRATTSRTSSSPARSGEATVRPLFRSLGYRLVRTGGFDVFLPPAETQRRRSPMIESRNDVKKIWVPTITSVAATHRQPLLGKRPEPARDPLADDDALDRQPGDRDQATGEQSVLEPEARAASARRTDRCRRAGRCRSAAAEAEADQLCPDDDQQRAADQRVQQQLVAEDRERVRRRRPSRARRATSMTSPGTRKRKVGL